MQRYAAFYMYAVGQVLAKCDTLHAHALQVNEKCDIYALGVILWECLTGARPFRGMHLNMQFMHYLQSAQWAGARTLGAILPIPPECPQGLRALLEACWAFSKDARPGASEVRRAASRRVELCSLRCRFAFSAVMWLLDWKRTCLQTQQHAQALPGLGALKSVSRGGSGSPCGVACAYSLADDTQALWCRWCNAQRCCTSSCRRTC